MVHEGEIFLFRNPSCHVYRRGISNWKNVTLLIKWFVVICYLGNSDIIKWFWLIRVKQSAGYLQFLQSSLGMKL